LRRSRIFSYRTSAHNGRVQLGDDPAIALEEARAHIENIKQGADPRIAAFEQKQAIVKAEREKASLGSFRSLLDADRLLRPHVIAAGDETSLDLLIARRLLR
jgi:hypothetical protein